MSDEKRIIVKPGGVGDTLLLAPSLEMLKRQGTTITVVGYPQRSEPLLRSGLADESVHLDDWLSQPVRFTSATHCRIDSFFGSLPPELAHHPWLFLHSPKPESSSEQHAVEYIASCLRVALPSGPSSPLKALLKPPDTGPITRDTRNGGKRILWIHPGSGGRKKRWPVEYFMSVATMVRMREEFSPVFLAGEAEYDLISRIGRSGFALLQPENLVSLVNLFDLKDVYLGNDSGPTHLAALTGVETIALFGPSDPRVWSPWGERVTILAGERPGEWVQPEEVLDALKGSA